MIFRELPETDKENEVFAYFQSQWEWLSQNRDSLCSSHPCKYVVIVDCTVEGAFNTMVDAWEYAWENYGEGRALIFDTDEKEAGEAKDSDSPLVFTKMRRLESWYDAYSTELVRKYNNRYLVISDNEVKGDFTYREDAENFGKANFAKGNYITIQCAPLKVYSDYEIRRMGL